MIKILDLNFLDTEQTIAAFLVEANGIYLLFETGPHSTFKNLQAALAKHEVDIEQIQHVFLTHIHFDHAGAAWALAAEGANIYLHPLGVHHLHEPSKLYNSAKRIYKDQMEYLWGKMEGIPMTQLKPIAHEEVVTVNGLEIKSLHTPGHAKHHIAWQIGDEIITGDVGGVKINDGMVVAPCPPPDINIEDWKASIDLLRAANASAFYLTHFGKVTNTAVHLDQLERQLDKLAAWMKPYVEQQANPAAVTPAFQSFVQGQLMAAGVVTEEALDQYEIANPSWMSVAGLMRYWKKKGVGSDV